MSRRGLTVERQIRPGRFTWPMGKTINAALARICRIRRADLDVTQAEVAEALGISRSHYAGIEGGRANPSLALVDRIGEALGVRFDLAFESTIVTTRPVVRDAVHAACVAYVTRRLESAGWIVHREVAIVEARYRGWIDVLAFHPVARTLLIIEVKTTLEDLGRLERQLGWYASSILSVLPTGWQPTKVASWALLLASVENDVAIVRLRPALDQSFPDRATSMRGIIAGGGPVGAQGLVLIDPRSRRRDWLLPSRVDGRRTPMPYVDHAGAARILGW